MQKGWKVFSHLNGKSRKKLLACLLSISMIPVNEYGATTNTAYGDGIYPLYAIKDKDDNIVEAIYHFMIDGNEL
jgi:hypothetical protein